MVAKTPNPSGSLSESDIWLPVCTPVTDPVAREAHDDDDPDDPVNVNTPLMFPELSSVRFAVNVVLPGGYRVDWVPPVQEELWTEGTSVADRVPMSSLTSHPEVLVA
jgi:hypothetical protein